MASMYGYVCLGGVEVVNSVRTLAYLRAGLGGSRHIASGAADCNCDVILDDLGITEFVAPITDPAPWYESSVDASNDFLGVMGTDIQSPSPMARSVSAGRRGGTIGSMQLGPRQLQVTGLMYAASAEGMAYGERWLSEALRGSPCEFGCPTDTAVILPACPTDADPYTPEVYFRQMVGVGLIDGPVFTKVVSSEWYLQQVSFNLMSSQPWLYHIANRCLDAEEIEGGYDSPVSCSLETPEWMGEGTFRIDIQNTDVTDMTDITIQGQISLDGSCPVSGLGTSVPPTFSYTIPTLGPEEHIIIDGATRQISFWDASDKFYTQGLPYLDFDGPFVWPDVGTCTTMCLTVDADTGTGAVTVDTFLREI